MDDSQIKELYMDDSVDKQILIETEDGFVIDNSMIYSEEFELTESLCSESELRFGSCEASCLKFKTFNTGKELLGEKISVKEIVGGIDENIVNYGIYKVFSVTPTADRESYEIVAYDSMYDVINSDVYLWYSDFFSDSPRKTLKEFRDSFFEHFGIKQKEIDLPNDWMPVEKTIETTGNENDEETITETLSGCTIVTSICEINGCFGQINSDGEFEYIFLKENTEETYEGQYIYPSDDIFPNIDIYPVDFDQLETYDWQKDYVQYEDFVTSKITKLTIIQEENDVGFSVGVDGNNYVISSNLLTYSLSNDELRTVSENILTKIKKAAYQPLKVTVAGNPCVKIGSPLKIITGKKIFYTYMLSRKLSGIQCKFDELESNGVQTYARNVNSLRGELGKIQGRSNVLARTIDETRLEIKNIAKNLKSEIVQTAETIVLKVDSDGRIVQVALSSSADEGSAFTVSADNISLEASDVFNIISNSELNLTSNNITIASNNFSVDENGRMSCDEANVTGDVFASRLSAKDGIYIHGYNATEGNWEELVMGFPDKVGTYTTDPLVFYRESDFYEAVTFAKNIYASSGISIADGEDITCLNWYTQTTATSANAHIGSGGKIKRVASSSKRYKKDITEDISEELNPENLYDVTIYQYRYKNGYLSDDNAERNQIGFIVENLEKYYPISVEYIEDENGDKMPETWNDRYLIPAMLKLIQEQKKEIDDLKEQVLKLSERVERYEESV